jgi:hypothetical protein
MLMKLRLKKLWSQFKGLFPTALPTGMTEFENWFKSFVETYDLPTKDENTLKFVISSIIVRFNDQTAYKSKFYFYLTIKSGAAKQIAGEVFYTIKEAQKKDAEAAKLANESKPV